MYGLNKHLLYIWCKYQKEECTRAISNAILYIQWQCQIANIVVKFYRTIQKKKE